MIASEACVDLIKRSEGFRMRPYADPAGLLTIGYGHKCCAAVGIVTEDEADLLLRRDLANVEEQVSSIVKVPLTQGNLTLSAISLSTSAMGAWHPPRS